MSYFSTEEILKYTGLFIFVILAIYFTCSGDNSYDGVTYKCRGTEEKHRKYISGQMTKWEATVYENWSSHGIFGKLKNIIKIIIAVIFFRELIMMLIAAAFTITGIVIFVIEIGFFSAICFFWI